MARAPGGRLARTAEVTGPLEPRRARDDLRGFAVSAIALRIWYPGREPRRLPR